MCLSAFYAFWDQLKSFVRKNIPGTALILFFSVLLSTGNGLLHYAYQPMIKLEMLALLVTASGFAGLVWTNKNVTPAAAEARRPGRSVADKWSDAREHEGRVPALVSMGPTGGHYEAE